MRYMGITDIILDTQQEWAASDDPNVVVENLNKIGRTAAPIQNDDLRQALERLGQNILNRRKLKES